MSQDRYDNHYEGLIPTVGAAIVLVIAGGVMLAIEAVKGVWGFFKKVWVEAKKNPWEGVVCLIYVLLAIAMVIVIINLVISYYDLKDSLVVIRH